MFENSNAAHTPKLQHVSALSKRMAATSSTSVSANESTASGPKSTSNQHFKNALNLGKAMGAKVNDLLRRKDQTSLGDIGVTEVNKNAGAMLSCTENTSQGTSGNSQKLLETFPRLDPPPPGKKRMPRALRTTQDMMISSDPVVNTPEVSDTYTASPDKTPLIKNDKPKEEEEEEVVEETSLTSKLNFEEKKQENSKVYISGEAEENLEDKSQLLPSVPDLIHKDTLDLKQKPGGPEVRMASTPCRGKPGLRFSISEDDLLNGSEDSGVPRQRCASVDNEEHHPDLLSFE
ncbi:uncharacterized protein C1orf226 [Polyodon spathula]|uniref:uncharacterized protein C1orf226 n=1 Tax=Polyodon spathula TaxID=7913 RepID=UPI001B7EA25D|nr:uncharacterized protein C1orf226 [Polyodon spathula]